MVDGAVRAPRDRRGLRAHAVQAGVPDAYAPAEHRGHRGGPPAELDAYVDLLREGDGRRAFLQIMRGFECTREKRDLYAGVLRDAGYPVQIVWGANDPALKLGVHGEAARRAAALEQIHTVPAKHFLQEDQAPAVAQHVADLAGGH